MKKKPVFYIMTGAVAVVSLVCTIIIPTTGKMTLLDEVFGILVMLAVLVMLIKALASMYKTSKLGNLIWVGVVALVIAAVIGSKSIDLVRDFSSGPEQITLTECEVEKRSTSRGIFSLNYYLKGEDANGESYRFDISGREYEELKGLRTAEILCYRNTGRIVEIKR